MAMFDSAQSSCDFIQHSVRNSGLNFSCQETPYSIFLTVRKSFIKSRSTGPNPFKLGLKHENILTVNNSLQEAFNHLKNDYEDSIAECESQCAVIEELNKKIYILNEKLSDDKKYKATIGVFEEKI